MIFSWLQIILQERLNSQILLQQVGQGNLSITCQGAEGAITFDRLEPAFLQSSVDLPCYHWNAVSEGWDPVFDDLLPAPSASTLILPLIEKNDAGYVIHYDILGLTYWMLTRFEEVGATQLDEHARFPATASHAYRNGYLDRPVVDEWLDILRQVMLRLWPSLPIKNHHYSLQLSHDVDHPSRYGFLSPFGLLRAMGGDVLKRRDFMRCMSVTCPVNSGHSHLKRPLSEG